ncbi:MAG: FixH family protein [Flavobacteriales bacterium]
MKISWGTGIVITFVIFIGLLAWAVTESIKADHHLVTNDYYEQELDYGSRMKEMENMANLGDSFSILQRKEGIVIHFPKHWKPEDVKGNIQMYKPDNAKLDFTEPILFSESKQIIPLDKLALGKWKVKVFFLRESETYYAEETFIY